jgi:signal transduction histidine kinase
MFGRRRGAASLLTLDEVRQILGDIRKDDLRASEVVRRLRALLRKREMEIQPINLNEVILDFLGLVRPEARRRGVTVETDLEADLPLVQADKIHLQQVLLNLFFNGMEAMADMPGEKRLTVRTAFGESVFDLAHRREERLLADRYRTDLGLVSMVDVLLRFGVGQFAEGKAIAKDAGKVAETQLAGVEAVGPDGAVGVVVR